MYTFCRKNSILTYLYFSLMWTFPPKLPYKAEFYQNWIFWQKLDFQNDVFLENCIYLLPFVFCSLFCRLSLDFCFSWSRTDCFAFGTTLGKSLCSVTTMLGVVGDPGADLVMSSFFLGKTNGDNVHIDFRLCLWFPRFVFTEKLIV